MSAEAIRVLVIDPHQAFVDVLAPALGREADLHYAGHGGTGAAALRLMAELGPDVVLMDPELPDTDGIALTERLRASYPQTRVVLLMARAEPALLRRASAAGASGFLAKDGALGDVLRAVHTAHTGGMTVSPHLLTELLRSAGEPADAPAGRDPTA